MTWTMEGPDKLSKHSDAGIEMCITISLTFLPSVSTWRTIALTSESWTSMPSDVIVCATSSTVICPSPSLSNSENASHNPTSENQHPWYSGWHLCKSRKKFNQSINQSIDARFVGRRYTTRPGAPAVVSCKHDQKVHFWSFSERRPTRISNVVKVGWKSDKQQQQKLLAVNVIIMYTFFSHFCTDNRCP